MDAQAGTTKFKQADKLFNEGKFAEALGILNDLDSAYPNTKNILYAKAMCLFQLGHIDEAESVCDWLLQEFQDPRAYALKDQIQTKRAAADADPYGGLDMSALDDLLQPTTKIVTPKRPPPSNTPRNTAIAVAAVLVVGALGAAGYMGVQKGWFFGPRETVEQVVAKIAEPWSKSDSYTASLDAEATPPDKSGQKMSVRAMLEFAKKGDKTLARIEGVVSVAGGPMSMDIPATIVSDGTNAFVEVTMPMMGAGKPMVIKAQAPPASQLNPDVAKMLIDKLHDTFDAKVLPEEMLDGMKAYVLQLTLKPGAMPAQAVPGMSKDMDIGPIKAYFVKDTMSQVQLLFNDKKGAQVARLTLRDIKFNADLKEDRFKYTPPSGAQVMDAKDAMGMIPGMPKM